MQEQYESYDINQAGEKGAEAYKKMNQERCDSLSFRNEEGRRKRQVEEHLKAKHQQTHNFNLAMEGLIVSNCQFEISGFEEIYVSRMFQIYSC